MKALVAPEYRIASNDEYVGHWVARQIKGSYHKESSVAIGLMRGERVMAGVLYEQWNGTSILCHMAATRLTPKFLAAIFDYPFNVCQALKIIAPVSAGNRLSIQLVEHMGFLHEATIADAYQDGHMLLYTMTRLDCRFLGKNFASRLETH